MKARSSVFFFFRAVARSCSLTLTRSLSRSRAHSRTRTHTHWFSQSLANLLAHFPSIYQSGKKRISNPVCFMQILVSPTPSLLETSPDNRRLTSRSCILGKIAAGNLKLYLPFLLKEIQANPKRQYLLLHSLKEVCKNVFPCSRPHFLIHTVTYFTTLRKVSRHFMVFHTMQCEGARREEFRNFHINQ